MSKNKIKTKKKIIFLSACMLIFASFFVPTVVNAYTCKVGDANYEACEEAKQNMINNKSEASTYIKKAGSVSEIITQLDTEISSLNSQIQENENKIAELNTEIEKTEKELKEDQEALAEMLVEIHFEDDAEPIRVLAGSTSISDLAEKQAREEVAKQEIAATSEKIKQEKEDLVQKKTEVEAKLAEVQENRDRVSSKRSEQESLKTQYEQNADDASLAASYWENQLKKLAWTPPATSSAGQRNYNGLNNYNMQGNCPQDNATYGTWYGGAVCQCTSYVSWKAYDTFGITSSWGGHAYNYVNASGYYVPYTGIYTYVDSNPAPRTIAVDTGGEYGHVMWVESVNSNGTINVTEYNVNWPAIGCYAGDFCSRNGVGTYGLRFVHFE
jgi:peptidoglycan hydrolase CwlO-like protein